MLTEKIDGEMSDNEREELGREFDQKYGQTPVTYAILRRHLFEFRDAVANAFSKSKASREALDQRITELEQKIVQLKAAPPSIADWYAGVWQPGVHRRGTLATWNGSLFLAMTDTSAKPETTDDWRLIAKRGKDGKDAHREPRP
jgi:hypothetical protein